MNISFSLNKKHLIIGGALIVLIAAAFLLFRGKNPTNGIEPNQTKDAKVVIMNSEGFSPNHLEIQVGDTVRFENKDDKARWPASDPHPIHDYYSAFDPRKPIEPGESWEFKFTQEGTWG